MIPFVPGRVCRKRVDVGPCRAAETYQSAAAKSADAMVQDLGPDGKSAAPALSLARAEPRTHVPLSLSGIAFATGKSIDQVGFDATNQSLPCIIVINRVLFHGCSSLPKVTSFA